MDKKTDHLIFLLKDDLKLLLSISFGVFLFVIFFQPFLVERYDFNNRLIFFAGLAGIVFVLLILVRMFFYTIIRNNKKTVLPNYIEIFSFIILCSVAFAFYIHYVGFVSIDFYVMFKVVLICLTVPVIYTSAKSVKEIKKQNKTLVRENKLIREQVEKYKEDYLNKSIELVSENTAENLNLLIADIIFLKSADNYVEVIFKEGDSSHKKLLRNTLKNFEQQLKPFSNFVRCHRTCIVNTHHIKRLIGKYNNYKLIINGCDEQIPVSRQYLLKFKEEY